ncbi:hypothetical protein [Janthinobacterium sp. ROICE36]|uniref:hypothetical protein n=1 Tax=Janthinobacterium sp. ROICE36 TaxID=2048670 RepID=UPI002155F083|nr:hypothetical protein [Janthinobacterium sp. ROICE36]
MRVGDCEGTVADVGMFETRLRTGLGEEVLNRLHQNILDVFNEFDVQIYFAALHR